MHISSMEEYALRCALQLAKAQGQGPLSASEIAEREGISAEYVSKFMHMFKKIDLVDSVRGVQGGFILSRQPNEISLKQVFDSIKTKKDEVAAGDGFCDQFSGRNDSCVHLNQCSIRPFWKVLSFYFDEVARTLTLEDLLQHEIEAQSRIQTLVNEKVKDLRRAVSVTVSADADEDVSRKA